jgi:hypothetical protein
MHTTFPTHQIPPRFYRRNSVYNYCDSHYALVSNLMTFLVSWSKYSLQQPHFHKTLICVLFSERETDTLTVLYIQRFTFFFKQDGRFCTDWLVAFRLIFFINAVSIYYRCLTRYYYFTAFSRDLLSEDYCRYDVEPRKTLIFMGIVIVFRLSLSHDL